MRNPELRFPLVMWFFVILTVIIILTFPRWITLFYPMPHQDLVVSYAESYDIDPLLVFSLIKVESRFSTEAISHSGAQGLMQLMPDTARWAANQLNMEGFDDTKLVDPETNIKLGCWYISDLSREFDGRLPLVIAAYNAGRGNVREWLLVGIWDGTVEDVQKVPFPETRNHIRKVLNEYEIYRMIYRTREDSSDHRSYSINLRHIFTNKWGQGGGEGGHYQEESSNSRYRYVSRLPYSVDYIHNCGPYHG
jgi:soluble lytic murein transglycosylase